MATRIDGQGMPEIIELRTRNSKSFQLPTGQIRAVHALYPVHWDNAGTWEEVDETLVTNDGGVTWQTTNTPYLLRWESDTLTLTYRSKKGGDACRIRLLRLNGVPVVTPAPLPTVTGRSISAFVAPDLEIELRVRSHGVEIFKILHGPLAPTSLTWGVQIGDDSKLRFDLMNTSGRDNILRAAPTRPVGDPNRVRRIEMTHSRTPDDFLTVPGRNTYEVTETFTGRTRFIDPVTSARSWVNEVEYPVEVDVTITELIPAAGDDGATASGFWYTAKNLNRSTYHAAFRFTTVNVPQGQTLDSATFTWNITIRSGTASATFVGEAVNSSAAWANLSANDPATMSKTTATATVAVPAATGLQNVDVKTIVQEIINRAGWAANNNLRLGFSDTSAMGADYVFFEDYEAPGTSQAQLVIVYTAAATGDFSRSGSIAARPGGSMGPRMRRALPQLYPDSPVTPVELTKSPAAPFRPGRGPAGGPMMLRRNIAWPSATFTPDVTIALTGVQATGSLGTLGVQHDQALTGNAATGAVGTLAPSTNVALTGVSATGSVGTLAPSTSVALSGVAGTGSVGTLAPGTAAGVAGVAGTGSVGTLAPSTTVTLTGNEATVSIGTLTPDTSGNVTIALTGVSASALIGDLSPSGGDVLADNTELGARKLGKARKPSRQRAPVYRHPEEIERERRMLEEYLESLETKARPASEEPVRPGESQDAPTRRAESVAPRLSDVMARLASAQQLELIARAESAAKADKAKAKKEHQRRRVAAIAVLMMGH